MASSCQLEFGLMICPFVVTEPKRFLLAQQHLGSVIDAKHYFVFIQVASTLAHGPEHRFSFDLAPPYFSLLPRDFLRPVVLIHHMLHMLEQLFLDSGSRIRQKVSRLGFDSSILVPFYLFYSSFLLLYMDIGRIGAELVYFYMVFTPLAGVKSFQCMADLPCIFFWYSSSILKGSLYGSFWYMLYVGWMQDFLPTPLRLGPGSMFLGLVLGLPSQPLLAE